MSNLTVTIAMATAACLMRGSLAAGAQAPPLLPGVELGPYVHQATLTRASMEGLNFFAPVAIAADTVLVGGNGGVYVFERNPGTDAWDEAARIVPSGAVEAFGREVAFDGQTAIIGAQEAAYLFRRTGPGAWREVAVLTAGDPAAVDFGSSVAVSGDHAIVGTTAPGGKAYVFRRRDGGAEQWDRVAVLQPGVSCCQGVAINADTAIVLTHVGVITEHAAVFVRNPEGDAWTLLRTHVLDFGASIALSDTTAVLAGGEFSGQARIFARDVGGANAWGLETGRPCPEGSVGAPSIVNTSVSGDSAVFGSGSPRGSASVVARHEGGHNVWGCVAFFPRFFESPLHVLGGRGVAISGDTLLIPFNPDGAGDNALLVYVSDIDRDGMRDGVDPCPRDPSNNVAGGCARQRAAYPVLDSMISLAGVGTESRGDEFLITATFTNNSDTAIGNPFFDVTELSGGNVLANSDAGPAGSGATLSPDVGDGVWSPGESVTTTFIITLETPNAFTFLVSVRGQAGF